MVIHKCGERLYNGVKDLIEAHLESEAEKKIVPVLGFVDTSPSEGVQVLKAIQKLWKHHVTCLLMISDILVHMVSNPRYDNEYRRESVTRPTDCDLAELNIQASNN